MTNEAAIKSDSQVLGHAGGKFVGMSGDRVRRVGGTFYRGETTNFGPFQEQLARPSGVSQYVLQGWMPSQPFINADTTIVAFGSCFANNISKYLNGLGFNVATKKDEIAYVSKLGDGMVNTFAIRQQFEWAWNNVTPKADLWHGYEAESFGYDEEVRLKTKALFDSADVFIITLGLSEIWYDEPTGEVFWRAVPADKYDPTRHKFRVLEYDESLENLRAIYAMIREHRPNAAIVFTLSPIALAATFRPVSCITANSESKAILRAAVGKLIRDKTPTDGNLFYFPSYEVVLECFRHQFGKDRRHVHPHVLDLNMKAFERYFCNTGLSDEELGKVYAEALALDAELGGANRDVALARITEEKTKYYEEKKRKREEMKKINRDALALMKAERKGGTVATPEATPEDVAGGRGFAAAAQSDLIARAKAQIEARKNKIAGRQAKLGRVKPVAISGASAEAGNPVDSARQAKRDERRAAKLAARVGQAG